MKEKIKKFFDFIIEVLTCRKKIKKLETDLKDPRKVLEAIMERDLNFYDYEKLEGQDKLNYYLDIQRVLTNKAFENEVKSHMADMIQEVAVSQDEEHRDKKLRFSINGLKCFLERLNDIQDPRKDEPTTDDIYNPI